MFSVFCLVFGFVVLHFGATIVCTTILQKAIILALSTVYRYKHVTILSYIYSDCCFRGHGAKILNIALLLWHTGSCLTGIADCRWKHSGHMLVMLNQQVMADILFWLLLVIGITTNLKRKPRVGQYSEDMVQFSKWWVCWSSLKSLTLLLFLFTFPFLHHISTLCKYLHFILLLHSFLFFLCPFLSSSFPFSPFTLSPLYFSSSYSPTFSHSPLLFSLSSSPPPIFSPPLPSLFLFFPISSYIFPPLFPNSPRLLSIPLQMKYRETAVRII